MPTRITLISVITPTYNRAEYLAETVESVLGQTYPDLEYIVLDDGSTDETPIIAGNYRGSLSYLAHGNMGEAHTVNKGFSMAKGDIVGIVNSDDPILPGLVERVVEAFAEDERLLVVYPDWRMIDQASKPVKDVRVPEYDYLKMVRLQKCLIGPGAFIRKRAFSLESGRDPTYRFIGDFEFWLRLGRHGPFARIPDVLATHRVHPGSESGKGDLGRAEETIRVVDEYFTRGNLPTEVGRLEREARSNAAYHAARMCMASAPGRSRAYYRESLRRFPGAYLRWRPQRLAMVVAAFLPGILSPMARRLMERLTNSPMQYYGKS
jgi:glycosyltransferase involved in cell wall biosynthesis